MMTDQEYQNRLEGLAAEIAYSLIDEVVFKELILKEHLEND